MLENVVREVVKATGDIITVAGNGKAGDSGDDGPATPAELNFDNDLYVDSRGDVFIADSDNNVVREFHAGGDRHHLPRGPNRRYCPHANRPDSTAQAGESRTAGHLDATIKVLKHRGPTAIGSVTFPDGAAILGTVARSPWEGESQDIEHAPWPKTIQAVLHSGPGLRSQHRVRSRERPGTPTKDSAAHTECENGPASPATSPVSHNAGWILRAHTTRPANQQPRARSRMAVLTKGVRRCQFATSFCSASSVQT